MPNLTITEEVAREVPLAPIPGHALVVYKQVDEGRSFFHELSPEQQFKEEKTAWWKRFISNPPSYVAFAINLNEDLNLKFSRRVLLQDHVSSFDLLFKLKYSVTNPRRVADRLTADPLNNLQNGIVDIVTEVVSNREWDSIRNSFNVVAEDTIALTKSGCDKLAAHWGFEIRTLRLERQLLEGDIKPAKTQREKVLEIETLRAEAEAAKERDSIEHAEALHKGDLQAKRKEKELENEGRLRRQQLRGEIERIDEEDLVGDHDLMRKIKKGGADALIQSLTVIADAMDNPRQLLDAIDMLKGISMRPSLGSGANAPELKALRAAPADMNAPNSEGSPLFKVGDLLYRTFQAVGNAPRYSPEEKTRLASALLHLTAEAMLGDSASEESVKQYHEKLVEVVGHLAYFTSSDLELFIKQNYSSLKEKLK